METFLNEANNALASDKYDCSAVPLSEISSAEEKTRLSYLTKQIGNRYYPDDPQFLPKYLPPASVGTGSPHSQQGPVRKGSYLHF